MENSLYAHEEKAGSSLLVVDRENRYMLAEAETTADVVEAQKLRFEVFNAELGAGLVRSFFPGL